MESKGKQQIVIHALSDPKKKKKGHIFLRDECSIAVGERLIFSQALVSE